jgi:hypothetical protein
MKDVAEKVSRALTENGFANGWGGDKSEEFIQDQATCMVNSMVRFQNDKTRSHPAIIRGNAGNLGLYTKLTADTIEKYAELNGYRIEWDGETNTNKRYIKNIYLLKD